VENDPQGKTSDLASSNVEYYSQDGEILARAFKSFFFGGGGRFFLTLIKCPALGD